MKSDEKLDLILKHALSPEEEPNYWLNQKILKKAKETERMKKTYKKRIPAAALVTVLTLCVGSATAFAAWKYLSPDKVSEAVDNKGLSAAFKGKDAITINETQEYGKYKITLLGVVSGKNLSEYVIKDSASSVKKDRTYVVTAIENADGTPMTSTKDATYDEDTFLVSPLIKGYDPAKYNAFTLNGGYTEFVQEGIKYRITECDNVEIFADKGLYLCVKDGSFYDQEAYQYNESTGEITRNESYDGVNALFDLPLDKSKADSKKAEAYIKELDESLQKADSDQTGNSSEAENKADPLAKIAEELENWNEADFAAKASLVDEVTQVLTPDQDGNISYQYQLGEDGMGSNTTILVDSMFEKNQLGMSKCKHIFKEDSKNIVYVETFTRNEDGTITLKVYECDFFK